MADYYQVKNQNIFTPPANISLGNTSNQYSNVYVQNNLVVGNVTVTSSTIIAPRVTTITYPGDDTAADTAGGQTITINGSGFLSGAQVLIGTSPVTTVGSVTVVSSVLITFISPAVATGNYVLYVVNADGATALSVTGIAYSGTPAWSTASGNIAQVYEVSTVSTTITATGDAPIAYSLVSGSLPTNLSLTAGNGLISGTTAVTSASTTYSFTARATDAQQQDTDRAFTITVLPDVVTWSAPAANVTTSLFANVVMSNVAMSATSAAGFGIVYTANTLPTGLSITGANIAGTPTVIANTSSLLTATANTSGRTSTRVVNWAVTAVTIPSTVEYLVVAGGGGGSDTGGGGAGGYRSSVVGELSGGGSAAENMLTITAGTPYTVTVGAGGTGGTNNSSTPGTPGANSVFGSITALGGGNGGAGFANNSASNGADGGSGGGGSTKATTWTQRLGGAGTIGQGSAGGNSETNNWTGGGGGGAGGVGGNASGNNSPNSANTAGNGGVGTQSSISGTATYYAGGGGGGGGNISAGLGGLGGGGAGEAYGSRAPVSGTANTGGGGGGGWENATQGSGGSGIVIIRYSDAYVAPSATTGSPTVTVAGGYRVYKWTSSGSITF